jgi:hypothetical protein
MPTYSEYLWKSSVEYSKLFIMSCIENNLGRKEYFSDKQLYQGDINGLPKHVFVYNCIRHSHSEKLAVLLARKNIALYYLPP